MPNAIDNAGVLNLTNYTPSVVGFIPLQTFVYDPAAKTVVVRDTTTYPTGDSLRIAHVRVEDKMAKGVNAEITVTGAPGEATIDVSTLNPQKGLILTVTLISTLNLEAIGSCFTVGAITTGNVAYYDKHPFA